MGEARRLDLRQAGGDEPLDQRDLAVGRDLLGVRLQAVARADLDDRREGRHATPSRGGRSRPSTSSERLRGVSVSFGTTPGTLMRPSCPNSTTRTPVSGPSSSEVAWVTSDPTPPRAPTNRPGSRLRPA